MGNLSRESREQNRKDKVTRFRSVGYASREPPQVGSISAVSRVRSFSFSRTAAGNRAYTL